MQRLPSARARYAAAIKQTRSQLKLQKERDRLRKRLAVMPQAKKASYFETERKRAEEKEMRTGKLYLHRYEYLTEEERKKREQEVKAVEKAKLENLALEHDFKVGKRVCVTKAPNRPGQTGMHGRIGEVTEVKKAEKICVVEGLEKHELFTIPFSALRPVHTMYHEDAEPEEVVIVDDPAEEAYKKRRKAEIQERRKLVERARKREGYPGKPHREEHAVDTPEDLVGEKTWTPELLRVPMPASIIDELRGKYSRHRRRWPQEGGVGISARNPREPPKVKKEREGPKIGGVLAELSLRDQEERLKKEAREGESPTMPSQKVLAMIGRTMAARGMEHPDKVAERARLLEAAQAGDNQSSLDAMKRLRPPPRKPISVEAKELDEERIAERRRKREANATYWPVKGWKEKQRLAAREAEKAKKSEIIRRELLRNLLPRGAGAVDEARA